MTKKYIPLYTKYRPMVFADITGQESTVKALSNAISTGRIMHAYLFCGPRGTGKTSSARIFAKSLNCVNGPTVTPCGKCPGCLDVVNSTPVDVIEIDAASNRSVEDARNILEKVQYAPLHGKYKIYIIDEVHMLTTEASNTLLKTLEEPPENVIFILATTESHKVLETIVSRCQRYDFRRITTNDIVKRLSFIAKSENIKIDEEALLAIAKNAAGGMRDAVALLDQLSVLGQNDVISVNDVNEILGQISYDTIFDIAECIKSKNAEKALKILNDINDRGNEPNRILTALIQYFRDMLIVKSCLDKQIVYTMTKINEANYEKIKEQSDSFDNQTLIYLIEKISDYFTKIKENTNKYMWAELCFIDITTIPDILSVAELTEKVKQLEQQISDGNNMIAVKKPVSVVENLPKATMPQEREEEVSEQAVQNQDIRIDDTKPAEENEKTKEVKPIYKSANSEIGEIWKQLTAEIKPPAKFFFSNLAKPIEINSHKIVIGFSNEGAAKQANDSSKKDQLKTVACKYFDVESIQIDIKVGSFSNIRKSSENTDKEKKTEIKSVETHRRNIETKEENIVSDNVVQKAEVVENTENHNESISSEKDEKTDEKQTENKQKSLQKDYMEISDTARNILELFDGKIIEN